MSEETGTFLHPLSLSLPSLFPYPLPFSCRSFPFLLSRSDGESLCCSEVAGHTSQRYAGHHGDLVQVGWVSDPSKAPCSMSEDLNTLLQHSPYSPYHLLCFYLPLYPPAAPMMNPCAASKWLVTLQRARCFRAPSGPCELVTRPLAQPEAVSRV